MEKPQRNICTVSAGLTRLFLFEHNSLALLLQRKYPHCFSAGWLRSGLPSPLLSHAGEPLLYALPSLRGAKLLPKKNIQSRPIVLGQSLRSAPTPKGALIHLPQRHRETELHRELSIVHCPFLIIFSI